MTPGQPELSKNQVGVKDVVGELLSVLVRHPRRWRMTIDSKSKSLQDPNQSTIKLLSVNGQHIGKWRLETDL